ncbi:hypothetical protein GAO09_09890 [Rhizobiales bacterium RZME27]|uniref:Formate dehydrogenase F4B subunit n=1 Tax=Endobacterium cereale TaxID=2663029 RepID=A0A6A8AAU7_9HYPH|nr:hypothetical protein [Endobacterium cereale]MEB2846348.1 hypothetical protein [Endobacterium cereale]MQY46356.1 hypothetical protein [Endobacterium cereale]
MTEEAPEAERFLALVAAAQEGDPALSPIQAAIMVAADLGIARDSRTFARVLGIEHALALRELNDLAEMAGYLTISKRDPRTLRTFYQPVEDGS